MTSRRGRQVTTKEFSIRDKLKKTNCKTNMLIKYSLTRSSLKADRLQLSNLRDSNNNK